MYNGLISPESRTWSAALDRIPHDVYHLPAYACASAQVERARPCAFVYADAGHSMLLPLLLRPIPRELSPDDPGLIDATSPYGYPGPVAHFANDDERDAFLADAIAALSATLGSHGVVSSFVRSHPLLSPPASAFMANGTVVTHGRTVAIDLTESEDDVWRQVRHDHRRSINKARRRGLIARIDTGWSHIDTFIDIYQSTMHRLDAARQYFFPRSYFERLRDDTSGAYLLCVVEYEGAIVAAGLFSRINGIIQYLLAGSTLEGLDLGAVKTMIHFMQGWGRGHGATSLHLGGGLGGQEDALFWFKSGFSHRYHPFWTWRTVPMPSVFERLVGQRMLVAAGAHDRLPDSLEGFFPPYRQP